MATKSTYSVKPTHIAICELAEIAYSQAEALVLQGYSFDSANLPQHFSYSGYAAINMILPNASVAK